MNKQQRPVSNVIRLIKPWLVLLFAILASGAGAVSKTWDGSVNADWFTDDNWTPAGVPANGDVVVINASAAPATNVVLSNVTARLGSLAITNAVLVFTNWTTSLIATNVTIGESGVFTLPAPFSTGAMSNRIHVVCTNLNLLAGGAMRADGKGFTTNCGAGAGGPVQVDSGGGAGHGGVGGRGWRSTGGVPGISYGSISAPVAPGSGGGGEGIYISGAGGGAIRVEAPGGTVVVNGLISANGAGGNAGGSGGSIFIDCATFRDSTNGVLKANGGNGNAGGGGGGGGGRIAIQYEALVNSTGIQFYTSAGSGTTWKAENWWMAAGKGTLYLSDASLLTETLDRNRFTDVRLYGVSAWSVNNLTVSNCSVDLAENGFQLTVSNLLTVDTNGFFGIGAELGISAVSLKCGGSLILTNGGSLSVYSGLTNGALSYGALVSVTNDLIIGTNSWVYPYSQNTNGGSALFRMRDLLTVSGSGFNALGRGFATSYGPGKGSYHVSRAAGGGYGGRGGYSQFATGGLTYGSTNAPIDPGSGSTTYYAGGGRGGGLVRIEARRAIVHRGQMIAKGGYNFGGGGAGGGIFLQGDSLTGTGSLNADGGNAKDANHGGGGGGRIAVAVRSDTLTGASPGAYLEYAGSANGRVSTLGGTIGYSPGTNGTFCLQFVSRNRGTLLVFR